MELNYHIWFMQYKIINSDMFVCDLISTPPENYIVTLGGNHTFICNSSAPVTWTRVGESSRYGNTLSLTNVHQKQAGVYYCSSSTSSCSQAVRFNLKLLHHWGKRVLSVTIIEAHFYPFDSHVVIMKGCTQ